MSIPMIKLIFFHNTWLDYKHALYISKFPQNAMQCPTAPVDKDGKTDLLFPITYQIGDLFRAPSSIIIVMMTIIMNMTIMIMSVECLRQR